MMNDYESYQYFNFTEHLRYSIGDIMVDGRQKRKLEKKNQAPGLEYFNVSTTHYTTV